MASPETVGFTSCACGKDAAVKQNSGGFAYYRCDGCGVEVRHHWRKTSDKLLQEIGAGQRADHVPDAGKKPQAAGGIFGF